MFSHKNISLLKVAMLLRQGSSAFNKIVAQQDQQADSKTSDIVMQLVKVA